MSGFTRRHGRWVAVLPAVGVMLGGLCWGMWPGGTDPAAEARAQAERPATLAVRIEDAGTGEPTPVRLRLEDASGKPAEPPDEAVAVMYGRNDRAEGYAAQPNGAFYVDGSFDMELPPGDYRLKLSKGFEYTEQTHELELASGATSEETYRLERWVNMPERGWYSADDHIHLRRSPRENPLITKWIKAEDVHVGVLLWMGDYHTTYFAQYDWGEDGAYREGDYMLTSGQEEPRTHEIGHTISMGADGPVRNRGQYYLYDKVFDRVEELGGVSGYAHLGLLFEAQRGMTLDVLRGKVDFLELCQFCPGQGPIHTEHYYHFLDLGFELTATGGSDFPWCGLAPHFGVEDAPRWNPRIGNARFYTYLGDEPLSFESWRRSLKAGRTFATSGPMLMLKVNGKRPGETVNVEAGEKLTITATALGKKGQIPLRELEIVGHQEVLGKATANEAGQSAERLTVELEHSLEHGMWIAARAQAKRWQMAHTTPVYVSVDGGGFHNPDTAGHYLELNERYLDQIEQVIAERDDRADRNAWRYREGLKRRIAETRRAIEGLRQKFE